MLTTLLVQAHVGRDFGGTLLNDKGTLVLTELFIFTVLKLYQRSNFFSWTRINSEGAVVRLSTFCPNG